MTAATSKAGKNIGLCKYRNCKYLLAIGQYIVEFEQGGSSKATYGKGLLENLSKDLSLAYGKLYATILPAFSNL